MTSNAESEVRKDIETRGLELEVIKPAEKGRRSLWMDALIKEFHEIAVDSFGRWLPFEAIDGRTRDADLLLVLRDKGSRAVGYTVNELLTLNGTKTNYFATGLLRRDIQGNGLYGPLNHLRSVAIPSEALMTRTQSPVVYRGFTKICSHQGLQVNPNGVSPSPKALDIAKAFCGKTGEDFIVKGVYNFGEGGRALMYDTPEPKTDIEKKIWSRLKINNGDAVIIVGVKDE
ncbi:hypothetical protein J4447_04495 [Candidatus Pacearchaeota archaeon]|nr:hypothetical protein [Candidatus Pacearchaeota archaeon]